MMTASIAQPVSFSFESQALAADTFEVSAFKGKEEISRPYRFDIDLVSGDPDIDLEKLLYGTATLTMEKGDAVRHINGVVVACRITDALPNGRYAYQVELRPRIWLLSMNCQNQIYQELSVPDIVAQEIKGSTAKGSTKPAAAGLTGDDFELRLTREYPLREYVVQYGESDLNFISRLMEHEGLFYYFEQGEEKEKLIVSDNNIHFATLEDEPDIAYRPGSGLDRSGDEAIVSLSGATRRLPRKLVLKDYNYRMPHVMLQAEADLEDKSHGLVAQYGDHFKTAEEGTVVARIRAQEIACAKQLFDASSDSIRLGPGLRFNLSEHFREAFNSEYVVTTIEHKGRQPLEATSGLQDGGLDAATYGNTFICIPAEVAFRPPRQTPKPVVSGLMNAHVDAALLENRAEIDDQGRYKLVMPFDLSGAAAGKASRFVRKAQPYGGQDMGMHFPLHKGTEVICTFINGDPDRPIITGVVPNPLTASVVTSDNYTKNVVKTAHGSYFEFNDGKGPADRAKDAVQDSGVLAAQQQQQVTAATQAPNGETRLSAASAGRPVEHKRLSKTASLNRQQQQQELSSAKESEPGAGADVWFRVDVPDYDPTTTTSGTTTTTTPGTKASYLRMGEVPGDERYLKMKASEEDGSKTYTVDTTDQTQAITCNEGVRYTVAPAPANTVLNPSYGKATDNLGATQDDLGVTLDQTTGNISFSLGFDKAGTYQSVIEINYEDSSGNLHTSKTTIDWTVQEAGNESAPDGWFDFTDGHHHSVARGNRREETHGTYKQKIFTPSRKPVFYSSTFDDWGVQRKFTMGQVCSFGAQFGTKESWLLGLKFDGFVGGSTNLAIASTLKASMGGNISANLDYNLKLGNQRVLDLVNADKTSVAKGSSLYGKSVKLRIMDPEDIKSPHHTIWQILITVGGLLATGVGAAQLALGGIEAGRDIANSYDEVDPVGSAGSPVSWTTLGAAEIAKIAIMIITSLYTKKKIDAQWTSINSANKTRIDMKEGNIWLSSGDAGIVIDNGTVSIYGDKISFLPENKENVTIDNSGISVLAGNIEVKKGDVKTSGNVEAKTGQLKSPTFSTDPVGSVSPPNVPVPKTLAAKVAMFEKLGVLRPPSK